MNIIHLHTNSASHTSDSSPVKSNRRLPWFKWYTADAMSETRGMMPIARLVYRELLDVQWEAGYLPANPDALLIPGITPKEWKAAWATCDCKFPIDTRDGLRRNLRLEELRAESQESTKKRVEAGRLGGQAKAAKKASIATAMPEQCSTNERYIPQMSESESDSEIDSEERRSS